MPSPFSLVVALVVLLLLSLPLPVLPVFVLAVWPVWLPLSVSGPAGCHPAYVSRAECGNSLHISHAFPLQKWSRSLIGDNCRRHFWVTGNPKHQRVHRTRRNKPNPKCPLIPQLVVPLDLTSMRIHFWAILIHKVEYHGPTLKTNGHKATLQPCQHAQAVFGGNQHGHVPRLQHDDNCWPKL